MRGATFRFEALREELAGECWLTIECATQVAPLRTTSHAKEKSKRDLS